MPASGNKSIPFCVENQTEYLCYTVASQTAIGINITSALVNMLHMAVILNVDNIRGSIDRKILVLHSVLDIVVGIGLSLCLSCGIQVLVSEIQSDQLRYIVNMARTVLWEGFVNTRFCLVCVSLADRYLVICRPLHHNDHFFKINFLKIFAGVTVLTCMPVIILAILYESSVCVDNVLGPYYGYGEVTPVIS